METEDLQPLQEPQISRVETPEWGKDEAEAGRTGVQTRSFAPQSPGTRTAITHIQTRSPCRDTHRLCASSHTMAVWGGCAEEIAYFLLLSVLFWWFLAHVRGPNRQTHESGGWDGQKHICRWSKTTKKMKRKRAFASRSRLACKWMTDGRESGPVPLASSWVFDSNQKTQISRSHRADEINVLLSVRFKRTVAEELSAGLLPRLPGDHNHHLLGNRRGFQRGALP